ncbi:MAG: AAA family ATPase [Thermoplasmata archaeon]
MSCTPDAPIGGREITTKVVCVTGMPGSGKEEFVKEAEDLGFDVVRMGDIVREEARKRGLSPSDMSVGGMANEEREKNGMGIWATRTIPKITGQRVVIDGIRGIAEIKVFREAFSSDLFVVTIDASSDVRFERIGRRGRKDATLTRERFDGRDEREKRWGIEQAMEEADHVIMNEGTLKEYHQAVRKVLEDLMGM